MAIDLDFAKVIGAVAWPLVVLTIFVMYRDKIPAIFEALAGRVTKLKFAGINLDLASAKSFSPTWTTGAFDLRQEASAGQINDSTAGTFVSQLNQPTTGESAELDLGEGNEWLTSRLYIMAILFARMKGVRAFVFLEKSGGARKRFACWAEAEKIRWALAKRYEWLERACAEAYAQIVGQRQAFVVDNCGALGSNWGPNPNVAIQLLRDYLQRIQSPPQPVTGAEEWINLGSTPGTQEHAAWLDSALLEDLLGADCHRSKVRASELRDKGGTASTPMIVTACG